MPKTKASGESVTEFIESAVSSTQKKKDSHELLEMMREASGCEPYMWGPSIVGFGSYHYKYASGHEGDAPLIGFSPRKAAISLYVFTGLDKHRHLLEDLGKFKMGKACIYIRKLADIDSAALQTLMRETVGYLGSRS